MPSTHTQTQTQTHTHKHSHPSLSPLSGYTFGTPVASIAVFSSGDHSDEAVADEAYWVMVTDEVISESGRSVVTSDGRDGMGWVGRGKEGSVRGECSSGIGNVF